MVYITNFDSPVGRITLAEAEGQLIGLWFENQNYFASNIDEVVIKNDNTQVFKVVKNWLDRYFDKKRPSIFEVPLSLFGSSFRRSVWKIICKIPYGEVTTYGKIAQAIAAERNIQRMSPQAVGAALAHNPISIIVPCHRVIGFNGNLTGYAGGIDRKIKILKHEGVVL